ncbi:hypothetical protein D3C87_2051890 [compost metagenome]
MSRPGWEATLTEVAVCVVGADTALEQPEMARPANVANTRAVRRVLLGSLRSPLPQPGS